MSYPEIWNAIQGVGMSYTIQVRDGNGVAIVDQWDGSEGLTCKVWAGADQATAATFTPTWISGAAGTIQTILDGATLATILPGVYEVSVQLSDSSQELWRGFLDLDAAAGTGTYRSLARLSDCQALLPNVLSGDHALDALPVALDAATRAIEGYCQRTLVLTDFDKLYRPGRTRRIQLDTWPVPILTRLQTDLASVLTITCSSTTNQVANVQAKASSQSSNTLGSLVFTRISSGVSSSTTLTAASYATVTDLVAAINAIGGGWSATVLSPHGSWPVSEISANPGTYGATSGFSLLAFVRDIVTYNLDPSTGVIELVENRPLAFRHADRTYGSGYATYGAVDPRSAGVRARYRAGYATASADLTAGYDPVPTDLRAACVMTAQAIIEGVPASGPVVKQSVKDRSYELGSDFSMIPQAARLILGRYVNARLF